MIPTEQQIALCEWFLGQQIVIVDSPTADLRVYNSHIPDTNSLDVLHEMEKKLTDEQWSLYVRELYQTVGAPHAVCATAPQRREALLRTLNLWRDETP